MSSSGSELGQFKVHTTHNRGFTPEELAEQALDRIIYVADNAHPLVADQARAFRENIRQVLVFYLRKAQNSERTTIHGELVRLDAADFA